MNYFFLTLNKVIIKKLMNWLIQFFSKNPDFIFHLSFLRDFILVIQILIFITYLIAVKKFETLKLFVFLLIFSYLIAFSLSLVINYPRPLTYYFNLNYFFSSFPSRHTMISTLIVLILLNENYLLFLISIIFLILVAYLSWLSFLHWPGDIIGGFILALIIFYFLNFFQRLDLHQFKKKIKKIFQKDNES